MQGGGWRIGGAVGGGALRGGGKRAAFYIRRREGVAGLLPG